VVFNDAEQDENIRSKIKNLCSASYTGTKLGPYMDALLKEQYVCTRIITNMNRIIQSYVYDDEDIFLFEKKCLSS
jgi:hypothetical protein